MSERSPVGFSPGGPPETVLPPVPDEVAQALEGAAGSGDGELRREAVSRIASRFPRVVDVWVALGDVARDDVESYACYRVGYHRGLDALRANGWRGSGPVRWVHPSNRGFLLALDGLRRMAEAIGEDDEAERCALFLRQLDPSWPPPDLGA